MRSKEAPLPPPIRAWWPLKSVLLRDGLVSSTCMYTWHVVRVRQCNFVGCAVQPLLDAIVGPRFDDHERIDMLALVSAEVSPVSNFIQLPTSRNNTQQHTTLCANARKMLRYKDLQKTGRCFTVVKIKLYSRYIDQEL